MITITEEQHARDLTWLPVPPLAEINNGLGRLQGAIDRVRQMGEALRLIYESDPNYNLVIRKRDDWATQRAERAWGLMVAIPIPMRATAEDYIRRRPNRSKQKYPVKQWAILTDRCLNWVARAERCVAM